MWGTRSGGRLGLGQSPRLLGQLSSLSSVNGGPGHLGGSDRLPGVGPPGDLAKAAFRGRLSGSWRGGTTGERRGLPLSGTRSRSPGTGRLHAPGPGPPGDARRIAAEAASPGRHGARSFRCHRDDLCPWGSSGKGSAAGGAVAMETTWLGAAVLARPRARLRPRGP